ncbi:hypothetical protein [Opitutus sp. ER46]|uniref:hypothetical protein n=1 Tax=Opitutus sp. ER46 TaxID=2161864 RepID=UPI000D2F77B8|nr:hypothetical protein [Opitutus sp. ER46]PTX98479.1 hypothetical protein DB354_04210 [Opitutus sp. ER46]
MTRGASSRVRPRRGHGGYLVILVLVILAFVGVAAAMQALVLTSVGTTSRAFDGYRQGTAERLRLERAVTEAVLDAVTGDHAHASVILPNALETRLAQLGDASSKLSITETPPLPAVVAFPTPFASPDELSLVTEELRPCLTPELSRLIGPRVAAYPPARFVFVSERQALETRCSYDIAVFARLLAAPLTRFPIAAYDLPDEIGATTGAQGPISTSAFPAGLVPGRDPNFVSALQAQPGLLPYHYRHRAALASAYQRLFSARFLDRAAEYAGITHFHDLEATAETAELAGLSKTGATARWDLGAAGPGTYGAITATRDAAVLFSRTGATTLELSDSGAQPAAPAILVVLAGPKEPAAAPLQVALGSITRPVVIVGFHVQFTTAAETVVQGALLLDPASSLTLGGRLTVGHLSYWAGSTRVAAVDINPGAMPAAAERIAPRAVYVATSSEPL